MWLLSSFQNRIEGAVHKNRIGLLHALLFPINFAFVLTFIVSRIISHSFPGFFFQATPTLHIHHFTYGIFILGAVSFLALLFNGPKAKFLISLLFGFGLGLAFDEFAMWLRLEDNDPARWEYDGFIIIMTSFLMLSTIPQGILFIKKIWRKEIKFFKKRLNYAKKTQA